MAAEEPKDGELTPYKYTLSRSNPRDVAHVNEQRERFARLRDETAAEGNETERHLASQLMLLTTVLITANLAIIGATDLTDSLTLAQRTLVMLSFTTLIISVVSGVRFYYIVMESFVEWGRAKNRVVLLFDKAFDIPQDDLGKQVSKLQDLPTETSRTSLYSQMAFLFLTLFLDFLLLLALLFDWSFLFNAHSICR